MFSTVADSYLRFPYLHFPPLHIRTYVFRTCIFVFYTCVFSRLVCWTFTYYVTLWIFWLIICLVFTYVLTSVMHLLTLAIGKVLQGFFNLWKVEEFYSTYSTHSTLHCMATGRILQYLIKLYITNKWQKSAKMWRRVRKRHIIMQQPSKIICR